MSPTNRNHNDEKSVKPAARRMHGLRLLSLLLLVSLACSIPGLGKPEATETPSVEIEGTTIEQTPTQVAGPIGTIHDLPPALVETDPPAGAQLPLDGAITLYFNQPMDSASVEGALSGEPQLSGSFAWPDQATLVFTPDAPLLPETDLLLSIAATAQSSTGQTLPEPVSLRFTTSSYLRLAQRLPEPSAQEIDPSSAVVAAFNRPVVPLGADPATLPAAFSLAPDAAGSGEWINTSTYIFYPEPALAGAATYQVTVNPALVATDGAPLDAAGSWTFVTAAPRLVSIEPPDGTLNMFLDAPVTIVFSQAMDTASVQANFSLLDAAGQPVSGEFTWDETLTTLTFTPRALLARGSSYTLTLGAEAAALGGAPLGTITSAAWQTVPDLAIYAADPMHTTIATWEHVVLYLTAPIPEDNVLDFITISPDVPNMSAWVDDYNLTINLYGTLDPETDYTLAVSPELTDRWGSQLGEPFRLSFHTTGLDPLVTFPYSSAITFLTPDDTGPLALVTNVTDLPLSAGSLPLQDFLPMLGPEGYDIRQNYTPADETSWTFQPDIPANQASYVTLPYRPDDQPVQPGLYFLWIDTPQTYGDTRSHGLSAPAILGPQSPAAGRGSYSDIAMVLAVSSYQTTFKLSATEAFVWAVDLRTRAPGASLPVAIYNESGELVTSGSTGADGVFRGALPSGGDPWELYAAILGQPGQDNFGLAMSNWNDGVAAWDFDLPMSLSGPMLEAYLYTDRPIYRPGDTVYFRGVVRQGYNGRYTLPDQSSFELIVNDGIGVELARFDLPLSGFGTLHGQFTIPDSAQPGEFRISDPTWNSSVYFLVTEYRKPEINLQVTAQAQEILNGSSVVAQVNARYFFDAPAGNQPLHWVLYSSAQDFRLPDGYHVGPVNTSWLDVWTMPYWAYGFGEQIAAGDARTGQDGLLTLEIPTETMDSRRQYTLEVTLTDESGLPVSARTTVNGNPAEYYIGVKPDAWSGAAERESGFSVLTVDWQGNPSPGQALTAVFQQVEYQRVDPPADQPYEWPTYEPVFTPIASTNLVTGADGMARLTFTPPEPGTYQLDLQGQGTLTQITLWVAGEGRAVWPDLPNQRLRLTADQESYQPGETAQVFIPNPFGAPATALLTVERAEVLRYQVLTLAAVGSNVDLPLTSDDAPNVFVSVTVIGQAPDGSPGFRQGYMELTVAVIQEHLNVAVTSLPERSGPGEPVTLTVQVSDASGAPVVGEFSLSLVDKAVLALAEPNSVDIFTAFYGPQWLGVRTGLSLAAWGQRLSLMPGGAGGGGGDLAPSVVREYFPDTAYWNAVIETDANGQAVVTVTLPDTLTTWQVLVRGLTEETWVGEAQLNLVTTQELLIRPVTPRFLVAADHVELAAIAQNNTGAALTGQVRLQASGFTLDDPASQAQAVTIPAGGQVRLSWWGTAQDVASADLLFSLQAGGLSDAVRVAGGALPVLRYTAPQTFATSGTLTEGGERLELVSLPVTFDPTSGALDLELSPSLAAAMLQGLDVLEHYPYECTEQTLSRFLPNLQAYRAVQEFGLDAPDLQARLERTLNDGLARLLSQQKPEGSWGWWAGSPSDEYLTAYVLYGLSQVAQAGISVPDSALQRAIEYLNTVRSFLPQVRDSWQLDRLAFESFALAQAGQPNFTLLQGLFDRRDELNPWAQALLALALQETPSGGSQADTLLSDLQTTALRSSTGVHWELVEPGWQNMTSTLTNSAMVIYALAQLEPASTLLPDAVSYLMAHRHADGAWGSTYESAWVMLAMTEVMRGTGELGGSFAFGATLNGASILSGHAGESTQLNPVTASLPLSSLYPDAPNALTVLREAGSGRLYYTAALQVYRPVADVQPLDRGINITRQVFPAGTDLRTAQPVDSAQVGDAVTVRLTLVLPTDAYYLVVEDYIPAGAEILNTRLQTSQLGEYGEPGPLYDPADPFASGWGWWLFSAARIYDDHIAFTAEYLPAGTYQLTYTLVMLQPGAYQVLPARAWLFYFPEVQGTTAGALFEIRP